MLRANLLSRSVKRAGFLHRRFGAAYSTKSEDDLVNVSLDQDASAIDTKNFFKYTWGRWLVNDEQERAARETRFSLRGLADVLTEKVNYMTKSPVNAQLEIKTIEPFHEGKHHKIYRVDLADGRSYALRIPYSIGLDEYRKARMQSEVATMDFLKRKHNVSLPSVLSWSPSPTNRLESEYMLLDFVKGDLLMKSWHPSSTDLKAKSSTIKPAVDFLSQIVSTKFNKYGSLYFSEDVDTDLQKDLPYEGETDHELIDRYRIGPTVESRFWKGRAANVSKPFRGPWTSVSDYVADTANVQLAYTKDLLSVASTEDEKSVLNKTLETFERYKKVSQVLFHPEQDGLDAEVTAPRLHDPDLDPINIVFRPDSGKSYLLDLENTSTKPFVLHGPPTFVRHKGPKIFKKEDIPDYDTLSDGDKRAVDHFIVQTQNQFAYEYLVRQANESLFPAMHPSVKRRQEIVQAALSRNVGTKDYLDLDYDLVRLAQEWQFLGTERDYPLQYSDQQLSDYVANMDEWSKHVMANPFIETKGWVPRDLFEQLLGEGSLIRQDDGSFTFTKPYEF